MRKAYNSKQVSASGPYSHAIDAGEFIFLSGQTAKNTDAGETANKADDITAQTEQCFDNLYGVLEAASLDERNVVKVNIYLTSMDDFNAVNEVYKTKFSEPYPARTCIAVSELPLGAAIEIELVAKRFNS